MTETIINDKELGKIVLRHSNRAGRYSIRIQNNQLIATIPRLGNKQTMYAFINEQRNKLVAALQHMPERLLLNENTVLQTLTFRLHIFRSPRNKLYTTLKDNILHIACPADINFNNEQVQEKLQLILQQTLRKEAIRVIPLRLRQLAELHHFQFNKVSIRNTKTRWGSCTSAKNISLSLSLMLLPSHLVDYILLHELCHTIEMNHGEHFWELMNNVTNGQAKNYRHQLKAYRML